ncbi:YveK family protein [Planococcus sp. X10-3]|uniref:YveK family protein n=1 Tax=Planococcus sp. X10-3 TaxID=3061240 RepID=UPI003BB10AD8
MEETISLKDLFMTIRKRLGLISLLTILAIMIAGVISFMVITPVYQSSTEILVNHTTTGTGQVTDLNIETDLQLINTYSGIIKSPVILDQVVESMNLGISTDQFADKITVSNSDQSQIVTITVQDENPAVAVEIANTTASVFENDIQGLMNVDNVRILSPAVMKENQAPVSPNPWLNMAIAAGAGLVLSVGLVFLLEFLDTTVKDQQDIEDILGIPVLGFVSPIVEKAELKQDNKTTSTRMVVG